jgi:hypothetical protein
MVARSFLLSSDPERLMASTRTGHAANPSAV